VGASGLADDRFRVLFVGVGGSTEASMLKNNETYKSFAKFEAHTTYDGTLISSDARVRTSS
jgi:hypothetical protein